MAKQPVVAIDGPAGAGKSSVSRAVAERLRMVRLDTGAMYRALTWVALIRGVDLEDGRALAELAGSLDIRFDETGVVVDGKQSERAIRDPMVNAAVSAVSRHPEVRTVMVARQQELAKAGGAVIEGRDIAERVAPWAEVKVFLTASADERARRRQSEMAAAGYDIDIEELRRQIEERDARDDKTTPLRPAAGAVVIDSTGKTLDEVVAEIERLAREAGWPSE